MENIPCKNIDSPHFLWYSIATIWFKRGGVAEWSIAPVLKTGVWATGP